MSQTTITREDLVLAVEAVKAVRDVFDGETRRSVEDTLRALELRWLEMYDAERAGAPALDEEATR